VLEHAFGLGKPKLAGIMPLDRMSSLAAIPLVTDLRF
jgi:hypothetical protein